MNVIHGENKNCSFLAEPADPPISDVFPRIGTLAHIRPDDHFCNYTHTSMAFCRRYAVLFLIGIRMPSLYPIRGSIFLCLYIIRQFLIVILLTVI